MSRLTPQQVEQKLRQLEPHRLVWVLERKSYRGKYWHPVVIDSKFSLRTRRARTACLEFYYAMDQSADYQMCLYEPSRRPAKRRL